nr:hypothetical protein [Tanacetum cinerariifolium]
IQVAQKKVKKAFENADSSLRVELIPSKIKYAIKVVLNFHNEFSVFSSLSRIENDVLLQRSNLAHYKDDEEKDEEEIVKTSSNDSDDEDETKVVDKAEGDEYEEMDYTTRNENLEILQVIKYAHVTLSTVPQKTKILVTSSSPSSDLAAKFLSIVDIPHSDAEIVSPLDVHVHHEVPSQQTPTLLTLPISVITDSPPVFSTIIPQSLPSFTPPPQQSSPTPPPIAEATNPSSIPPDFASVLQFNNRVTTLEKEVIELKKDDPLKTQVTTLVDEHLDEFMIFLLASLIARITEQVKNQLPQILLEEVSNFASPAIQRMLTDSLKQVRSQKDKDKDEDPSVRSNRGLKKRKTSKDAEPPKEEPEFEVTDSDMPHDQEENPCNDDEEPN